MRIHANMFEGIQLIGDDELVFVNTEWDEKPQGSWSDWQWIPEGHQIIGIRANNEKGYGGVLYQFEFVTAPKLSLNIGR